ncbi:U-box domain-containing protein 4, partial [Sesbania bispinosa]
MNSEPVSKYYQKAEKVLKVLKPIIDDATVYSDLASNEVLTELIEDLGLAVDELRELIENWNILSSKFYF